MIATATTTTKALLLLIFYITTVAKAQPLEGAWDAIQQSFELIRNNLAGRNASPQYNETIQVMGAGLARTGTGSLHQALNILGYHTYHMVHVMKNAHQAELWAKVAQGQETPQNAMDYVTQYGGFNATLDWPVIDYLPELLEQYPHAKVILTVRDNGMAWARSMMVLNHLVRLMDAPFSWKYPNPIRLFFPTWAANIHTVRCYLGTRLASLQWSECELLEDSGPILDASWLAEQYDNHVAYIQSLGIPDDRLLIFNAKQGWAPLCEFLSKPIPNVPFPHAGESAFLRRAASFFQVVLVLWIPVVMLLLWSLLRRLFGWNKRPTDQEQKVKQG